MRITNSMVTANTKANININKYNSDKLNTMTASGQKITRPSDDPVIAIRALRLNTSISELTQFSDKNIPDADAWYKNTETALTQADDVIEHIREKLNQAVSEENNTSSVQDILEELKQLKNQYYALGNADSAGRTVFTGFRTSEMLTFTEDTTQMYDIVEKISLDDLEIVDYVKGAQDITKNTGYESSYEETSITSEKYYRFKLSYDNLAQTPYGGAVKAFTSTGYQVGNYSGAIFSDFSKMTPAQKDTSTLITTGLVIDSSTGEVIVSKEYLDLIKANGATSLEVSYSKDSWEEGDLRPEHYFQCKTPNDTSDLYPGGIEYNYNDGEGFKEQEITYEIAFNQTIQINTHASDAFPHDIARQIDDLILVTQNVVDAEKKISAIESMKDSIPLSEDQYNSMMKAANKEKTLYAEKMHNTYQNAIGNFKDYSDQLNRQISKIGAMTSRLELTKNRVKDQKSNVKELADDNINADITETALDYNNAQLALEAARLAAGKIADQTLLNYI